jgi:NADPH:quinone reductase
MKAVLLEKTCKAEELEIKNLPLPEIKPGWVLIKIKAFGINRSEIMFRSYEADAPYIDLPRIPEVTFKSIRHLLIM